MNRLCYVAKPREFESPMSLLIRTAYYNGYNSIKELCKNTNIIPFQSDSDFFSQRSAMLELLTRECPKYKVLLTSTFYAPWDQPYTNGDSKRFSLPRCLVQPYFCYCPACLQSENLTVFQDLRITTCPIHNAKIICNCPECGIREFWQNANLHHCKCGFLRSSAAAEEIKFFSERILDIFDRKYLSNLKHLTWMIESCDTLWNERKLPSNRTLFGVKDELHAHFIRMTEEQLFRYPGFTLKMHLAPWAALGSNWYTIIHRLIEKHFPTRALCDPAECCSSISLTTKELRTSLERQDQLNMMRVIRENFIRIPQANQENLYRASSTPICQLIKQLNSTNNYLAIKSIREDDFINIQEACTLLKCRETNLRKLIKKGKIKTVSKGNTDCTRRAILINKLSAVKFQQKHILLSEICATLKTLPPATFRLIKRLKIAPMISPHPPYIFARSDIQNAMERLKAEIKESIP